MSFRNSLIAKVHMAKKQLGLEDDVYRSALKMVCGKTSCKNMSIAQIKDVLDHFKSVGFTPKQRAVGAATGAQLATIEALAEAKGLNRKELNAFVKRTTKLSNMRFLRKKTASQVILGLRQWLNA